MVELDAAAARRLLRDRRRRDFDLRIQQLEDAFAGGHRRLQDVVLLAQVLNRTEEALRIRT